MTIKITECTEPDELWYHYDGQNEPQPCYIELDLRNATLSADYNASIGGAVPATVYHGIDRRYTIPILTADAANMFMRGILPLVERIHADWEEVWDGNNMVAQLGEDATAAEEEIEKLLGLGMEGWKNERNQGFDDSELVSIWTVDSATNGQEVAEYGITAETTDQRLDEIAIQIMNDLVGISDSNVAVCHGLHAHLRSLRDELEREQADHD